MEFEFYQYPNLSEGADRVGGQLRGDKECPFSGITKSGRVWRKVPESDARSAQPTVGRKWEVRGDDVYVSACVNLFAWEVRGDDVYVSACVNLFAWKGLSKTNH